jgi:hypothetical protein
MDPITPPARPNLSVIEAAQQAIELVKRRLFPIRLERWLALGFVALLDQCGRGGIGGFPGGGGGSGGGSGGSGASRGGGAADELAQARDWIFEHLALIIGVGVALLVFVVALMALVTFLRSRGVFMYLDDVATGRADIVRPWREHADKAWSFFAWSFGASLITLVAALALAVPMVWLAISMIRSGPSCAPIGGIVIVILLFFALAIAYGLFSLLLRDFAAPLQLALGVPSGQALHVAWGLVTANPVPFLAYLALKLVFGIVAGIAAVLAGCFTCCLGFLPVISQTILQPLHYFERSWSLFLLRQAGDDLFPAAPPGGEPALPPPPG